MKKEVTPEIIKRLNDTLDFVCKYLAEENYDEANKLQKEYSKIEDEYNLFDYTYEENGKLGVKDITGNIRVPAVYCNRSRLEQTCDLGQRALRSAGQLGYKLVHKQLMKPALRPAHKDTQLLCRPVG